VNFLIDNWALIAIALVSGAMLVWPTVKGAGSGGLSATGAVQLINRERAIVVDVGEAEEYAQGHIGGSKNIPLNQLEQRLGDSVKNKAVPLILVCQTGARANRALSTARKLGYEKAQALAGGLKSWKDANLPLEKA
jgi:rhodanese-related sulfurtransferase